jgi:hypothetical protein
MFAGTSALQLAPLQRMTAQAQFVGNGAANFDGQRFLPAIAKFVGGGALFGDLTGRFIPAIANFVGSSSATITAKTLTVASASFVGAGLFQIPDTLLWRRWVMTIALTGDSAFKADGSIKGRIQAVANFVGASTISATPRQRMSAIANFVAVSNWQIVPRQRMVARATFPGSSFWQPLVGDIVPSGGGVPPNAPVISLLSNSGDTTPDWNVDLPNGAGNVTDALAGDVLLIQDSTDGVNWSYYTSYTLTTADLTGANMFSVATSRPSGSRLFRARLQRGSVYSPWSPTANDTIIVPPNAPSFTVVSAHSDSSPDMSITLPSGAGNDTDAAVNDVIVFQRSTDNGATWSSYFSHTIISADLPSCTISGGSLSNGTYLFQCRIERATIPSAWSASVSWLIQIGGQVPENVYIRSLANKGEGVSNNLRLRALIDKG